MHKDTEKLHGKTIESIDQCAINCWTISFTDGTKIDIWPESNGPLNISQLWLEDYDPENHKNDKI